MKRQQISNWIGSTYAILWLAATAAANAGTWEDLTYEIFNGEITITDCSYFATGDLEIPETIEGYPVTSIGAWAFADRSGLTSVVIPDGIIDIGVNAFTGCTGMTNFVVRAENESYSSIDGVLFDRSINKLLLYPPSKNGAYTVPDSVTSIERSAFEDCSGLMGVTIPDSVKFIGDAAFRGCTGLTSVVIPDSVRFLEGSAFSDCSGLTSVVIPIIASIRGQTFEGCSGLANVTIPDGITSIERDAFANCSSLTNVLIPDSVAYIKDQAFHACSNLTTVTIPDDVTYIGNDVFTGTSIPTVSSNDINYLLTATCAILTDGRGVEGNVVLPAEINGVPVRYIGASAFQGCSDLASVAIPDHVTSIGDEAFEDCTGLMGVTIPNRVATIGNSAFQGCSSLTSVTIGDGVTRIGHDAFEGTSIPTFTSNTVSYLLTTTCAVLTDGQDVVGTFVIPHEVEGLPVRLISDQAFYFCDSVTSVTIPDSVTSIGYLAFLNCDNLTSVMMGDGITYIEEGAFFGCDSLMDVILPDGITFIGYNAFGANYSTANVTIPSSVTYLGGNAFRDCHSLKTALFEGDAPATVGGSAFYNAPTDFTIQFFEGASGFTTPTWKGYPCEMLPSFGTWAMAFPEGQRDPADAPDGDGIPNLMKYAAGLEPGIPSSSADLFTCAAETTPSNSVFAVTYYLDPGAFDVSLYPIASGTLTNATWSAEGIATSDTGTRDADGRNIWKATLPTENDSGFLRLSAEVE